MTLQNFIYFHRMIARTNELERLRDLISQFPVTTILGSRQCGKTTLSHGLEADHRFDLENPRDLARLDDAQFALEQLSGLVVIDEVQRKPDLFPLLRYLADTKKDCRYVLPGSASPAIVRGTSESLAGRVGFLHLGGLRLTEVGSDNLERLWVRGGYPPSYTATTDARAVRWLESYVTTILERDIPSLGYAIPAASLRRFWTMLSHYHGQVFNASEIARSMDVSSKTAQRYLDILEGAMLIRVLRPWFSNTSKRLVKRPKIYLRDSGLFHTLQSIDTHAHLLNHPKLGASWEGFALEEVCRAVGVSPQNLWFWSVHAGAELDLFWQHGGRNWGVEFKLGSSPRVTRSIKTAMQDLELAHLWVVHAGRDCWPLAPGITAFPLRAVRDSWEYPREE